MYLLSVFLAPGGMLGFEGMPSVLKVCCLYSPRYAGLYLLSVFLTPGGMPGFEGSQLWNRDEPLHLLLSPCWAKYSFLGQRDILIKATYFLKFQKKFCKNPTWI